MTTTGFLQRFIQLARDRPGHTAVKDLEQSLTYAELAEYAAEVGAGLIVHGVSKGDRIALRLDNSVDFVVAALAALWIGAIFVPLNANDPDERVAKILADCEPAVVISKDHVGDDLFGWPAFSLEYFRVDERGPVHPMVPNSGPVYMIYTSGTTGTPKGVLIGSSAFAAAVSSMVDALSLNEETRTLCVSPFYFDGSFGSLFPTLYCGGTAVIRPRATLLFPQGFFGAIAAEHISNTSFSPTYLRLLLASSRVRELSHSSLGSLVLGGEACTAVDVRTLWSHAPHLKVFNRYGPTETTIGVTDLLLSPELLSDDVVPLGSPHPDVSFYLLDEQGRVITNSNMIGELYIGGIQLMDGYWGAPELTSEVLRSDVVRGELVYRTGDLVYRDDDGYYVYVERADRVVKRGGVRISLAEIADVVRGVDLVEGATCLAFDLEGDLGIIVFVIASEEVSALEILAAAAQLLPANMLPDRIEFVQDFPLTASGKLDERQLFRSFDVQAVRR